MKAAVILTPILLILLSPPVYGRIFVNSEIFRFFDRLSPQVENPQETRLENQSQSPQEKMLEEIIKATPANIGLNEQEVIDFRTGKLSNFEQNLCYHLPNESF